MRRVLLGAVLLGLLTPSCTDDFEQAAATAAPDGELRILYHPCTAERPAEKVQLLVVDGQFVGDGDDTVLWEVKAANRAIPVSDVMTFEPGMLLTGYSETVHLRTPQQGDEVSVYISLRGGGDFLASFSWGSLEEGTFLTDDGAKTPVEWLRYAREGCGGR
jgi:hypothetical protein